MQFIYWPGLGIAALIILILACKGLFDKITKDDEGWDRWC